MLELIKRCPEYVSGYKDYCNEIYNDQKALSYFRPTDPESIDENWFSGQKTGTIKKKKDLLKTSQKVFIIGQ